MNAHHTSHMFIALVFCLSAAHAEDERLNEHWQATFPKIDTNHDDFLSLEEVSAYLKRGKSKTPT